MTNAAFHFPHPLSRSPSSGELSVRRGAERRLESPALSAFFMSTRICRENKADATEMLLVGVGKRLHSDAALSLG